MSRYKWIILNVVVVYCVIGLPYSAVSGIVSWKSIDPALPDTFFPFESWGMFKLMLRSESIIRLEGTLSDGSETDIPHEWVFSYRSLEGRTVLDQVTAVSFLRMDVLAGERRAALARAIAHSPEIRSRQFRTISIMVDTFDVNTGEVFAEIELFRLEAQ